MNKNRLLPLTEAAMLVALSVVVELIKEYLIPFIEWLPGGGSIWISSVPIVIIALRHGVAWGITGGLIFGLINPLLGDDPGIPYWTYFIFDYLLAYGIIGVVGIFKNKANRIGYFLLAFVLANTLRFLMHLISGVIYFSYLADDLLPFGKAVIGSFVYNFSYMGPTIVVCTIIGFVLRPVLYNKN